MFSKRIREAFEKFARYTTLHGINRIVSSKHVVGKLLWTCIVLTCIAVCFMQIYKLGVQYGSKQVNTKVSIRYQKVYFPAVSFCNLNPVSYSKMKQKADDRDRLAYYLVEIHRKIRTKIDKQFEKASTSKGNSGQTSNYKVLYGGTVTLKCEMAGSFVPFVVQWLKQEGQRTINITSKNTSKYNHNYDNGSEISTASLTIFNTDHKDAVPLDVDPILSANEEFRLRMSYVDYIPDYINYTERAIKDMSADFSDFVIHCNFEGRPSLKMLINVNQSDYVPYVASDAGIRLVIHEHGSQPYLENSGISVATGFRTDISLIQACFEECIDRNVKKKCKCLLAFSLAETKKMVTCFKDKDFECIEDVREHVTGCKCRNPCRDSLMQIDIFFSSLYEEVTEEVPSFTFENFLSNIGGTLGLWIGMSLISIGELVELGFFLLRSMARQKKVIETQTTVNGEKAAEPSKGSKNQFVYLGMNPIDEGNGDK
ncbi:unnamed protein product [Mytilus edulis]|uniref:Uncharacterized protein n=1 Tax=Mytilus edulis TaxID=6550 RepID=A0A8S3VLP2_MYTED|nr:unnamed protein product [Mytilus edulis]